MAASVAGLVSLTYGLIRAGQDGWSDPGALVAIVAGVAIVVGFLAWERRLTRRPGGRPLARHDPVQLGLVHLGVDIRRPVVPRVDRRALHDAAVLPGRARHHAMGSGLRLLPLVGGVVIGAVPAAAVAEFVGAKIAVAAGFALLAGGLASGRRPAWIERVSSSRCGW